MEEVNVTDQMAAQRAVVQAEEERLLALRLEVVALVAHVDEATLLALKDLLQP